MLGCDDGVSELIGRLLVTLPDESPRDRRTHTHERVVRVERAEDDPLTVGIAPVQPVGLGK